MVNIGIILTRKNAEKKKDELVNIQSHKRPWLKLASEYKHLTVKRGNKICVPGDVSIGLYILWNWNNVNVDFILPTEISPSRLKKNDLNFMLIYDLVESFHVDNKKLFEKFRDTIKNADNVYPPYYYQKMINNKCLYINHLGKKKCPVIPTYCVTKETFSKYGKKRAIEEIKSKVSKWEKFIAKPVYGQESIDFKKFNNFSEKTVSNYVSKGFKKYPGLIFQKYIDGFDKSNPEIRMYFVGNDYKYSVITNDKTVKIPKSEMGTENVQGHSELIRKGKEIMGKLPQIKIKGKNVPRLLTRVDIGCEKNYKKPWLLNEVEFVPSLYIENVNFIPEISLGDRMVEITKKVSKK